MPCRQGGYPIFVSLTIGPLGGKSREVTPGDAYGWRAKLDGVDVSNDCVEADDVKGYVMLLVKGEDGRPVYEHGTQRDPEYKRVSGRVELIAPVGEESEGGDA